MLLAFVAVIAVVVVADVAVVVVAVLAVAAVVAVLAVVVVVVVVVVAAADVVVWPTNTQSRGSYCCYWRLLLLFWFIASILTVVQQLIDWPNHVFGVSEEEEKKQTNIN